MLRQEGCEDRLTSDMDADCVSSGGGSSDSGSGGSESKSNHDLYLRLSV